MEDLKQKYEMLHSNLELKKQEKLQELVNVWLQIYKQDLDCVLANTDYVIEQSPKLIPHGGGLSLAKIRFQSYIKHSQTGKIILLDVGFNAYKNKPEKERMPYLKNWLERALTPRKKKKEPKNLVERFELMLKSFDNGSDLKKSIDTLHELNKTLRSHLKNIMKGVHGTPTIYDWRWNCNISKEQIKTLIHNLTE